jgi:NAD(P)-dependent dehydrogenase (short-subunit alcohol dehydrogenase family)
MKNVLITGGNSGIGLAAAEQFLDKGYRVIIAARNQGKLDEALEGLKTRTGSDLVSAYSIDLSDFEAVKVFAETIKKEMPVIDILALNAGVYTGASYDKGVSGYELMISATHLGHFLLTHLLLDSLKASAKPRVVVTSSLGHMIGGLDIESFKEPKYASIPYLGPLWGYGQAKLANILFTREFTRRFADTNIVANCFHPGAVDTGFSRYIPSFLVKATRSFLITPEKAAKTLVYLGDSDDIGDKRGEYFVGRKISMTSAKAKDTQLAKDLWLESEKILGLS